MYPIKIKIYYWSIIKIYYWSIIFIQKGSHNKLLNWVMLQNIIVCTLWKIFRTKMYIHAYLKTSVRALILKVWSLHQQPLQEGFWPRSMSETQRSEWVQCGIHSLSMSVGWWGVSTSFFWLICLFEILKKLVLLKYSWFTMC